MHLTYMPACTRAWKANNLSRVAAVFLRIFLRRCNREAALRAESGMRRMLTNPFKSVIPLVGDYDINVVIEALKLRDCRVSLHVVFNPRVSLFCRVSVSSSFQLEQQYCVR